MTLDPLPRKHQAINYLTFVQAPKLFPKKDKNHTLSVTLSFSLSFRFSNFEASFCWRSNGDRVRSDRFVLEGSAEDLQGLVQLGWFRYISIFSHYFNFWCQAVLDWLLVNHVVVYGLDGDGRITGNEGAKFFAMSKLSRPELKQVFQVSWILTVSLFRFCLISSMKYYVTLGK